MLGLAGVVRLGNLENGQLERGVMRRDLLILVMGGPSKLVVGIKHCSGNHPNLLAYVLHPLLLRKWQHLSNPPIVYHKQRTKHSKVQPNKLYDHNSYVSSEPALPEISVVYVVALLHV